MKAIIFNNQVYQKKAHGYHFVHASPWPLLTATTLFTIVLEVVAHLHEHDRSNYYLYFNMLMFIVIIVRWGSDISTEASYEGRHTKIVQSCLSLGFILFILSEVMFFGALFGSYIYTLTHPAIWIGCEWPPSNSFEIDPFSLPLANAFLLIVSGLWGEMAHNALSLGQSAKASHYLTLLMILGGIFLIIQLNEYLKAPFGMDDSIFGSLFYFITGFHGIHVCAGLLFVFVQYYRIISGMITRNHHLGFDFAILYWHFVDIIWLIVWFLIYFYPTIIVI